MSILLSWKTILLPFVTFIAVIFSQVAQNCCFRKKYHWVCPTMQFWRENFFWKKWSEMQIKFFGTTLLAKVYENQRIFDNSTYFRIWAHSPLSSYKRVFLDIGFRFRFTLRITSNLFILENFEKSLSPNPNWFWVCRAWHGKMMILTYWVTWFPRWVIKP